ncbi:MAG: hypothetical protein ACOX3V_05255 [Bacillota bacterium]
MKKVVSTLVVMVLVVVALASCSGGAPQIAKVGLGLRTSIAKSTDLTVNAEGKKVPPTGQVDTVIAAVAFDKAGKIVQVTIDTQQTKVAFDENLQVVSDTTADYPTKVELRDGYGMGRVSSIGKEWYEQAAELEKWMIGKTVEEVKSMKVKERDAEHKSVPDVPELASLVTMDVGEYIQAVADAYKNAVEVGKGGVSLGLGHNTSIASSKSYSVTDGKEVLPVAQVDNTIAATAFDKDGKVVRTIINTAQTKVNYDKDGKVTSDRTALYPSKVELGDNYGMGRVSSIGKEWYQQIAELEKWMEGKTANDIKSMKTKERDASHTAVPDVPELTSLVTVTVEDYINAVVESSDNAKPVAKK